MKNWEKKTMMAFWTVLVSAVLALCGLTSLALARVYSVTIEEPVPVEQVVDAGPELAADDADPDYCTLSGTVTWNLPSGYDAPDTIQLLVVRSDGEQLELEAFVENGAWSVEGLPRYEYDGAAPYEYTVQQVLPEESMYVQVAPAPHFENKLKMAEVSGSIQWNVPAGFELPESVDVLAYNVADPGEPVATVTTTKADDWNFAFDGLPLYAPDGSRLEYVAQGSQVEGFEVSNEGGAIVYSALATVSIAGTKAWDLPEGYPVPESIDIVLERSDGESLEVTVLPDENGMWSVDDLPGCSEDGSTTYEYIARENLPEDSMYQQVGEGIDFVNKVRTVSVAGHVMWIDYRGESISPSSASLPAFVTLELQRADNDGQYSAVASQDVAAGADGDWAFEFAEQVMFEADGTQIAYRVVETALAGIAVEAAPYAVEVVEQDGLVTVTNAQKAVATSFSFQKYYYADASSQANAQFTFLMDAVDESGNIRVGNAAVSSADGALVDDGVSSLSAAAFAEGFVDGVATVQLPSVLYTQPGEYYYQVREADAEGHTGWDTSVYTVHVSVAADGQTGSLSCIVEYLLGGQPVDEPSFTNNDSIWLSAHSMQVEDYAYSPEGTSRREVWVDPKIRLQFLGGVMAEGMFSFELYQIDENGNQVGESYYQTNDSYGVVDFDLLGSWSDDTNEYALFNYSEPGTYWYAMRQIPGEDPRIQYSDTVVYYCIDVFEVGEVGALDYSAVYSSTPGYVTEWPDPTLTNSMKAIDLRLQKRSVDGDALEGAVYGLWMVNDDGNDAYVGSAVSDADGWMTFSDVNMAIGAWYYFKEEVAPSGHLVDPYTSEQFMLDADEGGFFLVYR